MNLEERMMISERDADEKLRMELFPELQSPPSVQVLVGDQILNPVIENLAPEPPQPYRVQEPVQFSGLPSTPVLNVLHYFEMRRMTSEKKQLMK